MKALFITLACAWIATSAQAATISSDYPMGTKKSMASACDIPMKSDHESVEFFSCPVKGLLADAGYELAIGDWEHGAFIQFKYRGQGVETWNEEARGFLSVKEYKVPQGYESFWHANVVGADPLEVRYTMTNVNGKTVKTPFAIIYREVSSTFAFSSEEAILDNHSEVISSTSSGLYVLKLDGLKSKVIGVIDVYKSDKALQLARDCADSIVGKGNSAVCNSTLTDAY